LQTIYHFILNSVKEGSILCIVLAPRWNCNSMNDLRVPVVPRTIS